MMLPPSKFIFLLYVSASLTTIELVIWAGNYRHREKGSPERKSESEESNTHEGIKKIEYNGTPKMRRSLAELGENAVPDAMWTKMTTSVIEREKSLDGVYALHVSKSGGTSLCDAMKSDQCFIPPDAKGKANCWAPEYRSSRVDLGTKWVRYKKVNETDIKFKNWVYYDEKRSPSSTCSEIRDFLYQNDQSLAMSENWLPIGGVCEHDFLNVIILRHPLDRLLSHYQHLYDECVQHSTPLSCTSILTTDGHFDIDFMNKTFDIITDNYNVRSLNEQHVYKKPTGFNGKGEDYLNRAIENLHRFDWVLILRPEEDQKLNQTKMIMEEGIGLSRSLPISRKRSGRRKKFRWSVEDEQQLRQTNSLDLKLWAEAKRINELDVISIRKMQASSSHLWQERQANKCTATVRKDSETCCGIIQAFKIN